MSFKVQGHNVLNPLFIPAMKALSDTKFPFKSAWNVKRMIKQFDKVIQEVQKGQADLILKYAEKDEEGMVLPDKDEEGKLIPNSYIIPKDKQTELNVEGMKLMNREFTIESNKLTSEELEHAVLSATDLEILDLVMDIK